MLLASLLVVEEADPLKQGLKRKKKRRVGVSPLLVEEADPLKQGLKHPNISHLSLSYQMVEEADPLKQGLKPRPSPSSVVVHQS